MKARARPSTDDLDQCVGLADVACVTIEAKGSRTVLTRVLRAECEFDDFVYDFTPPKDWQSFACIVEDCPQVSRAIYFYSREGAFDRAVKFSCNSKQYGK